MHTIYCIYTIDQLNTIVNIYHYANHYINSMFITLEKQHHILLIKVYFTYYRESYILLSISIYYVHSIYFYVLCRHQYSTFYFHILCRHLPFYFMLHICTLRTAVSCPSVLSDLLRASSAIFLYLSIWDCCDALVRWRRPLSSSNSLMREDKPVLVSSCKANILD